MRIRDALLSARSYLTILIGFLLGFAIVVWVEKQMPARVESSGGMTLSQDFPPLPPPRELTFDEAIWARVAGALEARVVPAARLSVPHQIS